MIPDPDWDDFDGLYAYTPKNCPKLEHNLQAIVRYMDKVGKTFEELTEEEIEQFRIKKD